MTASLLSASELVAWGVLYYAMSVVLVPMTRATGWSTTAVSGAFSVALLMAGVVAPAVGVALERYGSRLVMSAGSIVATLGVTLWSRAGSLPELYAAWVLIGAAMAATLYEPAFATIVRHHRRRQRPAILAITLVGALAATVFQPVTQLLVAGQGWRAATATLAVVLIAVTLPCHLALPGPRSLERREHAVTSRRASGTEGGAGVPRSLTTVLAIANGANVAVTVHLVAFLIERGTPPSTAAWLAGAVGLAKVIGRIVATVAVGRATVARVTSWTLALQAVALLLPVLHGSIPLLVVHVGMFGAASGAVTVLRPWLVEASVGAGRFARADGKVQLVVSVAKAAGPLLLGAAATVGSGYASGWIATATMLAGCAHHLRRDLRPPSARRRGGLRPRRRHSVHRHAWCSDDGSVTRCTWPRNQGPVAATAKPWRSCGSSSRADCAPSSARG